jgi:hypothetical protein
MIAPINSVVIMAVEKSTSFRDILKAFTKYASVSHIYVDGIETSRGGKYNRVYVSIDQWNDTEDAYAFIKLVRNGRARLNYWWDVRDNTKVEKTVERSTNEFDEEKKAYYKMESDILALLGKPKESEEEFDMHTEQMMYQMREQINYLNNLLDGDDNLSSYYDEEVEQEQVQVSEEDDIPYWMEMEKLIDYYNFNTALEEVSFDL